MPISWNNYEQTGQKSPPPPEVRAEVERTAAHLLGLPPEAAERVWGTAIGYGCSSAVVLRVAPGTPHRFQDSAPEVVVKVFRTAAWKSITFQQNHVVGRDLPRVQRSFAAEIHPGPGGKSRGYAVLEYVAGESLERRLRAAPVPAGVVRSWIRQCLVEILVPLWADGHRFWDMRPPNIVLSPDGVRLTLIDNDLFRLGTIERDCQPDDWSWRDHLEGIAVGRGGERPHPGMLPRLVRQLLRAQRLHSEPRLKRGVEEAWQTAGVAAALGALGRRPGGTAHAGCAAVDDMINQLAAAGLLPGNTGQTIEGPVPRN
jgi:hypothetical protein